MTPADPLIGAQLGEYVVKERIGVGGMGIVYRAVQPRIGKQVAIKVLSPHMASHPEAVHRLLAEARIVSTIRHHGIIDIFGFGELPDGRQYMVMEYLQGTPLDSYLAQRKRLEPAEAFSILDEVLSALGAAHAAGVVHRDLKPNNIFLVQQPDGTRYIKLFDFGIAKEEAPSEDSPRTATGEMLGTPAYMAPEQVHSSPVSPRTDLYALGVVAFKLLTGQLPFSGDRVKVLLAQVHEAPPVPSQLTPGLPPGIDQLILWLMAKSPEERPASTDEVRRAIAELRTSWEEPPRSSSALPTLPEQTLPLGPTPIAVPPRPRRWTWAASASLGLVIIGGLVVVLLHRPPPFEASRPAPVAPPSPAPPPPAPLVVVPKEPVPPSKLEPQPAPAPRLKARHPKAKPHPKPGAAQLAQYTRLKHAYEAQVRSGAERNVTAEEQLESAREFAEQASKTQNRKEAQELIKTAQALLDDWARDFQR